MYFRAKLAGQSSQNVCMYVCIYVLYKGIRFIVLYLPKCSHDLPSLAGNCTHGNRSIYPTELLCTFVCTYACTYDGMYVCMYVCMYVYLCMLTCILFFFLLRLESHTFAKQNSQTTRIQICRLTKQVSIT